MSTQQQAKPMTKDRIFPDIKLNNMLLTLFVDNLAVHTRKDGMYFLRFTASLPEGNVEQCRLLINKVNFLKIIDTLCHTTKYYPEEPKIQA
jgi:hypothetical protein